MTSATKRGFSVTAASASASIAAPASLIGCGSSFLLTLRHSENLAALPLLAGIVLLITLALIHRPGNGSTAGSLLLATLSTPAGILAFFIYDYQRKCKPRDTGNEWMVYMTMGFWGLTLMFLGLNYVKHGSRQVIRPERVAEQGGDFPIYQRGRARANVDVETWTPGPPPYLASLAPSYHSRSSSESFDLAEIVVPEATSSKENVTFPQHTDPGPMGPRARVQGRNY